MLRPGDMAELFGPNLPLEIVAEAAETISYELLTNLGQRYRRVYNPGSGAATGASQTPAKGGTRA